MKRTVPLLAACLAADPALAHAGAHLHPHDMAGWFAVLGLLAILAAAAVALRQRR